MIFTLLYMIVMVSSLLLLCWPAWFSLYSWLDSVSCLSVCVFEWLIDCTTWSGHPLTTLQSPVNPLHYRGLGYYLFWNTSTKIYSCETLLYLAVC